jgi:hypothetical protein
MFYAEPESTAGRWVVHMMEGVGEDLVSLC